MKLDTGEIVRVTPSPSRLLGLHPSDCEGCYMGGDDPDYAGPICGSLHIVNCRAPRGCCFELVEEAVDETDAVDNVSKDSSCETREDSDLVES